jgi:hypothetical protein
MRPKPYGSRVRGLRAELRAGLRAGTVAVLFAALALTACTLMAPQAPVPHLPDDYLPTAIALTIQAVMPDLPATPQAPGEASPRPPTPEPTLEPTSLPEAQSPLENPPESLDPPAAEVNLPVSTPKPASAAIQILSPGPASKVTSPIRLNAFLAPGDKGNVRIELLGEDGRLLVRQLLSYGPLARIQVITELDFEISAAGELGRLRITTEDPEGRMVAVASVDLLLISLGQSDITPSADSLDRIIIQDPGPKTLVQGGNLRVSGFIRPSGEASTWVELITAENRIVGYRQISIPEPQETGHTPFSVDVPYTVSTTTWVRLSVSQRDGRIPGFINLSSLEVLLSP